MHHREMPPVAGGVEGGGGVADVLTDDRGIADLPVAQAKLVVGQPDGPRIMSTLGLLERLGEQGDPPRRLSAGDGEAAVHAQEVRQARGVDAFPGVWQPTKGLGGLADVILEQPPIREGATNLELFVAGKTGVTEGPEEKADRLGPVALLERLQRLAV
jgi:hypothetical protein